MASENQAKATKATKGEKRFGWVALLLATLGTGLIGALATLIVEGGWDRLYKGLNPPKPEPAPKYQVTLSSPISDDSSQRRFQFLLIENVGDAPVKDLACKIACVRTVDISGERLVDFTGASSIRRTADAIHIEAKSVPAGGSLLLIVWHKLGGIEPGDIVMTWQGKLIQPEVRYLR